MARNTGYLQSRRGIWEHVRDGRMSLQDVAVHQYIASQADTRTRIWNGSAGALAGELCISRRMARRVIERLTRGDYIRRFPIPGRHICYPILVHKFLVTDGEHGGEQLNALASISPTDLRYFPGEHRGKQKGQHEGQHVTPQKKLETVEGRMKKNPAAKTAPPADSRFQSFYAFAFESFRVKHNRAPIWNGKDRKNLSAVLREHGPDALPLERLRLLWDHFTASTEPFTVKQGDSLAYFCSNLDKFADGPILAASPKGTNNGNATSRADNLRGIASSLGIVPRPAN
jgi:hypothetical protein